MIVSKLILSSGMIEIRVYTTPNGRQPFIQWLENVDREARRRINVALARLEEGNIGSLKSVGDGVCEIRADVRPRLPSLSRPGGRPHGDFAARRYEEAPER
jgi:hypothetical protein